MQVQGGFELIQSFVILAEELNFRRSAELLNVDQSALSRRIRKLEGLLGFALFDRSTHDVSLTPAGRIFYEDNAHLLADYAGSIEKARLVAEGKDGVLRIGHLTFAAARLIPPAVTLFQEKNPSVHVHMQSMRTPVQKLALASGEIDLGYMGGPFEHREFESILLKSDPLYVVMPSGHPLAEKRELDPADLKGLDLVWGGRIKCESYSKRLDELFNSEGVRLQYGFEAPNPVSITGYVLAGGGVTIFPKGICDLFGPGLEFRPIAHPDFAVPIILVWQRANRTKAVRSFIEVAKSIYPR